MIKNEIAKAPVLAYYNPKEADSTQNRCKHKRSGSMLAARRAASLFASKALTEAQKGYTAIELESLAVMLAMEKFHHFLYASHVILETYQKPLEAVLSKSLNQATLRLQRILIRTFPYHFKVCYIPGLTNQLADCLSHLGGQEDTIKLPLLHLYQIRKQLSTRNDNLNQFRLATQEDDELVLLKYTITQGWPSTIKEVPQCTTNLLEFP